MIDTLLLLAGNDIPFASAQISIHQPTLKEIGYIGENEFHHGTHFLLFDKSFLSESDKKDLENISDFDIFMSIMNSPELVEQRNYALMVLTLMFPNVRVDIKKDRILLVQDNVEYESSINGNNFGEFQNIVRKMYCLDGELGEEFSYNPADGLAQKIADKLRKRHQKLNQQVTEKIEIFPRYISILAVGMNKDMNELSNYTVYQISDEFKRFQLKNQFDIYMSAKMAGATDLEEVENWMDDIHSKKKSKSE